MINKSIAYSLRIYISLAVISVFLVLIFIYYLFNRNVIKENAEGKAIASSAKVMGGIVRPVLSIMEISSNISEEIIYHSEQKHTESFIRRVMHKYSFINAIQISFNASFSEVDVHNYYCNRVNDSIHFLKANQPSLNCITKKESYQKLLYGNSFGWSQPILCEQDNKLVVVYSAPIYSDNESKNTIVGKVICEFSLSQANELINSIKISKRSYSFLMTKEGNYITHPNSDLIFKRSIYNLPKKMRAKNVLEMEQVLAQGLTGTSTIYSDYLGNEKCWVYYTPIPYTGWMLIFIQPYKELYAPLFLPTLQMLIFSILGILLIYFLITYITKKQIHPLSVTTQQLKHFSRIAGASTGTSENEVSQLSESLDFMRSWYDRYKVHQLEEEEKSKTRKRDIKQAAEIQQSFIKTNFPAFPKRKNIDLYAIYKPARGVSGDLFDYFFLDKDHLLLTMGDVSGKGIPAALFMTMVQAIIKNKATCKPAREIVALVNSELYTNNHHQFFITLFLGVLNVKTGHLNYCNAAHTTSYLLKGSGEIIKIEQAHGLPLGLYPDRSYTDSNITLGDSDSLILYTDGYTDQQNAEGLQYGEKRFRNELKSKAKLKPNEIVIELEESLKSFMGEVRQSDDISMLVLKYKRESLKQF